MFMCKLLIYSKSINFINLILIPFKTMTVRQNVFSSFIFLKMASDMSKPLPFWPFDFFFKRGRWLVDVEGSLERGSYRIHLKAFFWCKFFAQQNHRFTQSLKPINKQTLGINYRQAYHPKKIKTCLLIYLAYFLITVIYYDLHNVVYNTIAIFIFMCKQLCTITLINVYFWYLYVLKNLPYVFLF